MDPSLLPIFWGGLISFAILVYVLLDVFDLGVGILFGTTRREDQKAQMLAAIGPVWDGNETWLILVGASLYGAFPVVYAVFLSALYLPVTLLLFALIFRGVAFEFRNRASRMRWLWDGGFFFGSLIAAFVQGAAIGNMVQGLRVEGGYYAGGSFDWVNPFGLLCGVGLIVGYALLGATWLVLKTGGELRDWAAARIRWLLIGALGFVVLALVFVLATDEAVVQRWVEHPWLAVFPLLAAVATVLLYRWSSHRRGDAVPFLLTAAIFLTAFLMLGGSFWPYMVPYSISIADAASPTSSLEFLFHGAALVVFPVVLLYTAGVYWVFRGKVDHGADCP
jgi:cytochrome d ubiquinol oxidase subunit II